MDTTHFDIPRYLSELPLFNETQAPALARLATGSRLRNLRRGDMVFRAGEPSEEFHVTVTGQVRLYLVSRSGQEKVIELVGPGNCFAEAMLFTGETSIVNAQTLGDSLLLSVGRRAVLAEIADDPRLALRMLACISRRHNGLVHDVEASALQSGVQRVIGYLQDSEVTANIPNRATLTVSLRFSCATIASLLSLTPEYFSRVLHQLQGAGLIEIGTRDIRILDSSRLATYQLAG